MKSASISQARSQLSALIDAVKHGETVIITDRDRPVARLGPITTGAATGDDARLTQLERAGVLRRGNPGKIRTLLETRPPGVAPELGVLEALIEERRKAR